jgi:hypothetical protein
MNAGAVTGRLPFPPACELWENLSWRTVELSVRDRITSPVVFPLAPAEAGIYRVTLVDDSFWSSRVNEKISVRATRRVLDPELATSGWKAPVVLSIGKTTNLSKRLAQHLGNNPNNNRLLRRLRQLAPGFDRETDLALLRFEVALVPDWRKRFLLEAYGTALHQSLLDFTAEH